MQGNADPSATGNARVFTDAGSMRLLDVTRDVVREVAPEELPWVVNVFQLTAAQQAKLDHQPQLALSPHEIVAALDLTPPGQNGGSPPGLR
jgi:hypothetical protein